MLITGIQTCLSLIFFGKRKHFFVLFMFCFTLEWRNWSRWTCSALQYKSFHFSLLGIWIIFYKLTTVNLYLNQLSKYRKLNGLKSKLGFTQPCWAGFRFCTKTAFKLFHQIFCKTISDASKIQKEGRFFLIILKSCFHVRNRCLWCRYLCNRCLWVDNLSIAVQVLLIWKLTAFRWGDVTTEVYALFDVG